MDGRKGPTLHPELSQSDVTINMTDTWVYIRTHYL